MLKKRVIGIKIEEKHDGSKNREEKMDAEEDRHDSHPNTVLRHCFIFVHIW